MSKASPIINSFAAGALSPRLAGRTDINQYFQSAEELNNVIVEAYGGAKKAPGTYFVKEVKNSNDITIVRKFVFSDEQAYIIEIGDLYMRFYMDDGQILSGGYAYEIATSYPSSVIRELQFSQTSDLLFITHPAYPQSILTRTGHTAWTLTPIDYSVDPNRPALMDENITATTITPSATTGSITLTASVAIFDEDHIGSIWAIGPITGSHGYAEIISVSTGGLKTVATATVLYSGAVPAGATTAWSEAAWSIYRGYPKAVGISEQRLVYAYTPAQPQTAWASQIGAYHIFELGIEDSDALQFSPDTNEVETIKWVFPAQEILLGTAGGVTTFGTGSDATPLTPTTGRAKKKSTYGASSIRPQMIGNSVFYFQEYNRILREYVYSLADDNFLARNATIMSEHITESGITEMAYQQNPNNLLWCVRADGKLAVLTFESEQKVSAWTLHDTDGYYESVAVIPKESYDEVWFVVRRVIGGVTKRYIEYMVAPEFENLEDMFFVHSGLTVDVAADIDGIATADPIVITVNSHGYSNLNIIRIRGVLGTVELNDKNFAVVNKTADTFELAEVDDILDTYTKLLLHCNGADESTTFTDEVGKTVTVNGTVAETLDQSFTVADSALFFGYPGFPWMSQSFTPAANGVLTKASLDLIIGAGSPSFNITCELQSDNGGVPSNTAIATSSTILNAATVTGSHVYYDFVFDNVPLVAGTVYHLVWKTSAVDSGNYVNVYTKAAGGYSGGAAYSDDGSGTVWASRPYGDMNFKQYYKAGVEIDTAQSVFGGASGKFFGGYLSLADHADWDFGTGNFTIDFWVRFASVPENSEYQYFITQNSVGDNWSVAFQNNGYMHMWNYASGAYVIHAYSLFSAVANTWYHVAMVRNGTGPNCIQIYKDGVAQSMTLGEGSWNGTFPTLASELYIGSNVGAGSCYNGWIDEMRISKGIARWTADFTLPTAPYASSTPIDGSAYTTYISGGEIVLSSNVVTGLSHLEGKTAQILADGDNHDDRVVASGAITLDNYYGKVTVGLGYTGRIKTNDLEASPGGVTSQGKTKRVSEATVRLYRSLECTIGTKDRMDAIIVRPVSTPTGTATPLFTGVKRIPFPSGFDKEKKIIIEQKKCLAMHVLAIVSEIEVN